MNALPFVRNQLTLGLCIVAFTVAGEEVAAPKSRPALPALPAAQSVPAPGPLTDLPYAATPILPGGVVMPLYPTNSAFLKQERLREPEQYNLSRAVPGRIASIVNIHNPSIEFHPVDGSLNTGAAVILVAGGGHNTLNVGTEAADFVPYFFNYGVNTIILRNRLRRDGYSPQVDAVRDALQAIRLVRAYSTNWSIDPNKIGMMGFSAGAELTAPAALAFQDFDQTNHDASDPLAGVSCRPDFVALVYPGPTPFAREPNTPVPTNAPPSFVISAGSGDRIHAIWADQYFAALLKAGIPNLEMHIYGNGYHPGSGSTGGLTDRNGTPFGKWQDRFIDWFRDLGFLQKPGVETKAARDIIAFVSQPPRNRGPRANP
ncbi:MAG: alpha/beta hydrolase [Verrucomicrobiota bacterium]